MLDAPKTQTAPDQPAFGCLLRLFWMAFGNMALLFAGLKVSSTERVGTADLVYAGVTLALLLARWVDITKLNGLTVRAEPATRSHLRRYSVCLVGIALLGWAVARWLSTAS